MRGLTFCFSFLLLTGCGGGSTSSGAAFNSTLGGYYEVSGNGKVCVGGTCVTDYVSGLIVHVSTTGKLSAPLDWAPECTDSNVNMANTWNTASVTFTSTCSTAGIVFSVNCYQTYNLPALTATEICSGSYEGIAITSNNVFSLRQV